MSDKKITPLMITEVAAVAALYVALTYVSAPFAFGAVQFRISEALMLLCCFRKRWCVSLTVGCMLANLISPMLLDFIFGTSATLIAAVLMYLIRKPIPASVIPAVANGLIVGAELNRFMGEPFWFSCGTVALGEIVCVMVIGLPLLFAALRSEQLRGLICGEDRLPKRCAARQD